MSTIHAFSVVILPPVFAQLIRTSDWDENLRVRLSFGLSEKTERKTNPKSEVAQCPCSSTLYERSNTFRWQYSVTIVGYVWLVTATQIDALYHHQLLQSWGTYCIVNTSLHIGWWGWSTATKGGHNPRTNPRHRPTLLCQGRIETPLGHDPLGQPLFRKDDLRFSAMGTV